MIKNRNFPSNNSYFAEEETPVVFDLIPYLKIMSENIDKRISKNECFCLVYKNDFNAFLKNIESIAEWYGVDADYLKKHSLAINSKSFNLINAPLYKLPNIMKDTKYTVFEYITPTYSEISNEYIVTKEIKTLSYGNVSCNLIIEGGVYYTDDTHYIDITILTLEEIVK